MKRTHWAAIVLAGINLIACDVVEFPGADTKEERPVPPPPIAPEATPSDSDETLSTNDTSIAEITPAETPAAGAETIDATDTIPEDTQDIEDTLIDEYASIDNLLAINAARCAPTTAEASLTLAEIAGAKPASATATAQAVNATAITTAAFPGIVKMEPKRTLASGGISSGHCGATRIAKNWFITASHCLDDTYDDIDLIATESSLTDPRAVRVQATASLCHAAYGGARGQYSNDVALIGISDEAAAAFSAVPIARFGATDKPLGTINYPKARMAGWGLTSFDNGELSNTLLTAELNMISSGPALVTVASRDTAGPCIGDSGGPLLIDEADGASKVIGVLSVVEQNRETGEFCKGNYNARYTNLQGYTGWIESVIGVCTDAPKLCAR